jgi:hypothetical protein
MRDAAAIRALELLLVYVSVAAEDSGGVEDRCEFVSCAGQHGRGGRWLRGAGRDEGGVKPGREVDVLEQDGAVARGLLPVHGAVGYAAGVAGSKQLDRKRVGGVDVLECLPGEAESAWLIIWPAWPLAW